MGLTPVKTKTRIEFSHMETPHTLYLDADSFATIAKELDPSYHFVLKLVCKAYRAVLAHTTRSAISDYSSRVTLMEWARSSGFRWTEKTWAHVTNAGPVVLKWMRAEGCPWNERTCWAANVVTSHC